MQTTHKIPGGSATTWAKYLVAEAKRGDYYAHDGEGHISAPTQWHGPEKLLRSFGIDPSKPVELKHLRPLMAGFNPVTHEEIRPVGSNGTRTAGVDLTFSPPKDVSALWATADPYRRAQIETAHRQAVKSALERTEREVTVVRRKLGGVQSFERAKTLLAVEAVHTTSRLSRDHDSHGVPDPQLHSHIAIIAAERKDGKLAAVESKQLMRAARENGAWYRAELAGNLMELGLDIERRQGKGERYFGIHGVSKELSEHWSTRSEDVNRAANVFRQRYGREPAPGELDSITLETRGSKSAAPASDANAAWKAIGEEHNQTAKRSEELFHDWGLHAGPEVDLREELLIEITRERSMITTRELRAKAYELSAGVCRPAEADRLIKDSERSGELLRLQDGTYTTKRLRELEQATIATAQQRAGANVAPVSDQAIEQARLQKGRELRGSLSREQREALDTITGPGGIAVLVGQAGTGKGVVLSAATDAWQKEGYEVIGTAIPGATAMRLQADTKTDRTATVDSLITSAEHGHLKLDANTVIVVDEAGMFDSERLPKLVKLTNEADAKLVLAGDAAQLSSIGAGGLFKELEGEVPTAELTEVHRAHHEWEKQAWLEVREGEPGKALARYQEHDRLHIYDTRAEATEAMVENWNTAREGLPADQTVMITDSSNEERDRINAMAQQRRAQAGELGAHRVQLPDKPYGLAAGDEVIFTDKYKIKGQKRVENGITGTVAHASPTDQKVTIQTRESPPREVEVDTEKFSDLSLGYAVHIRKGQGMTAETSGILAGGWQTDKEHIYVSLSRARERTDVYITREDLGEQGMDTGAIQRFAERMKRSRAQEASITKQLAQPTADRPTDRTHDHTPAIDQPTANPSPDTGELMSDRKEQIAEQTADRAPTVNQDAGEHLSETAPSPQPRLGSDSELNQVLQERRARQFEWERFNDVDRTGDLNEKAREVETIEKLAEHLRGQGADEATITKAIAKQTAGPEAALERNTKVQRDHQKHIEKILNKQRKRLIDQELALDRNRDLYPPADRSPAVEGESTGPRAEIDRPAEIAHPSANRPSANDNPEADRTVEPPAPVDPADDRKQEIQAAIEAEQERQQNWERGIEPDNDLDRGFGIE
jgi:conjugative relaxase-like TrwC/TraI family protein